MELIAYFSVNANELFTCTMLTQYLTDKAQSMSDTQRVLTVNNDLPIRTHQPVHNGKVRSVYWLTKEDSARLIKQKNYNVEKDAELAVMVISDRISAFECIWRGENGLDGIPGKGAALNTISQHWFELFKEHGLADSHILDVPHPLVWIVQKAKPVMIEAIARQYITGSMWRAYSKGERLFCGEQLPNDLEKDQKLDELLITPSTKGIIKGLAGVPEVDDVNISRKNISDHYQAFRFRSTNDIDRYETLLKEGFHVISDALAKVGEIFVDTKFEFGYVNDANGEEKLIYMDEVGTPDSSRIWDAEEFKNGNVVEKSKEEFRQILLNHFDDPDIFTNKNRMDERYALAENNLLPEEVMMQVSKTYSDIAEKIIGKPIKIPLSPKEEIIAVLAHQYGIIDA